MPEYGLRNSAKAKTKDVLGRVQKGHFMQKRHQILLNSLQDSSSSNLEPAQTAKQSRIEDIKLAHAQRDLGRRRLPEPIIAVEPRYSAREKQPQSSSPSQHSAESVKRSKVLEALDMRDREHTEPHLRIRLTS